MALRAPRAKRPLPVEDDPIDENAETATLTGSVAEGEEPITLRVAKQLGWKPKEEWPEGRDPEGWVDYEAFLENTPKQVEDLRARNRELTERSERSARAAAEVIEEDRRKSREEAQRVIRESDNPDERARAAERLAQNAGPPPETRAWLAKNPWFETDPDAQALATATVNRLAGRGATVADQLSEAEATVKKRFPEYFANGTEQRLSDVRRQAPNPPQVQPGTRAMTTQTKDKGFAEIPAGDRQAFRTHLLKHFTARGLSQPDAEKRYAQSYWREHE